MHKFQISLEHPKAGGVYQSGSKIWLQTPMLNNGQYKLAKIWDKGVCFTSPPNCPLTYLLDPAGIRTTHEPFYSLINCNIVDNSFFKYFNYNNFRGCFDLLSNVQHFVNSETGTETLEIADGFISIVQKRDGLCSVHLGDHIGFIQSSPNNGKVKIKTRFFYVTASSLNGENRQPHLFVKSFNRRIHYCGDGNFVVRNSGHSVGFNEQGMIRIY